VAWGPAENAAGPKSFGSRRARGKPPPRRFPPARALTPGPETARTRGAGAASGAEIPSNVVKRPGSQG
jgi:hypothetical protein